MNTDNRQFRDDLHRSPSELESEANEARQHLEHTLEALERRLSPGELLDTVLRTVRGNGSEFGQNLATQVRNNPVPVLLTGAGLAWLIGASNRPPQAGDTGPGMASRVGSAASSAGSALGSARDSARSGAASVGDAASRTSAGARSMAQDARERASHAAASTSDAARRFGDATRSGAQRVSDGYDYLRREQPLVLGALAVAAGALIGAMSPSTRAEDRALGEYRDQAVDELRHTAQEKAEQAKQVAADTAETAKETAKSSAAEQQRGSSDPNRF